MVITKFSVFKIFSLVVFKILRDKTSHSIKFVEAVRSNDKKALDDFSMDIIPRLIEYLMVTVQANRHLAEECAHQAYAVILDRILKSSIEDNVNVVGYMLITARNEYFSNLRKESREGSAVFEEQLFARPEEQIASLIKKERLQHLQECLNELEPKSRDLIEYMIKNPEASFLKLSKIFNTSPENIRTRKSRILKILTDCYKLKSKD